MKDDDKRAPVSPKVLAAVQEMVDHAIPLKSIQAWWDVARVIGRSEDMAEDDENFRLFWNDLYYIGNILFAAHDDAINVLKKSARMKPTKRKKKA